ncbi:hypothetical protein VNO78_18638 [Psophocarpus tetragonolobus]|uniref:Transmembrane protein n=1 Tax=Psophocarpus tetragonolobus TaxID=3891 RepID=A0AAN9XMD7_PSOTE
MRTRIISNYQAISVDHLECFTNSNHSTIRGYIAFCFLLFYNYIVLTSYWQFFPSKPKLSSQYCHQQINAIKSMKYEQQNRYVAEAKLTQFSTGCQ